ncbi:MAG: lactoylglutathione lyase, partial [Chromatocurvus sp.]
MKYLHTMVRASSLDDSLDFYCNRLGLVEVNRHESETGRFTLVYLAAPGDVERAHTDSSPLLEITWNWDPEA